MSINRISAFNKPMWVDEPERDSGLKHDLEKAESVHHFVVAQIQMQYAYRKRELMELVRDPLQAEPVAEDQLETYLEREDAQIEHDERQLMAHKLELEFERWQQENKNIAARYGHNRVVGLDVLEDIHPESLREISGDEPFSCN